MSEPPAPAGRVILEVGFWRRFVSIVGVLGWMLPAIGLLELLLLGGGHSRSGLVRSGIVGLFCCLPYAAFGSSTFSVDASGLQFQTLTTLRGRPWRLDGLVGVRARRGPFWPVLRWVRIERGDAGRWLWAAPFRSDLVEAALVAFGVPVEGAPATLDRARAVERVAEHVAPAPTSTGSPEVLAAFPVPDLDSGRVVEPARDRVAVRGAVGALAFGVLVALLGSAWIELVDAFAGEIAWSLGFAIFLGALGALVWAAAVYYLSALRLVFCDQALIVDPGWPWEGRRVYPYSALSVRGSLPWSRTLHTPGQPATRIQLTWFAPGALEAAAAERGVALDAAERRAAGTGRVD